MKTFLKWAAVGFVGLVVLGALIGGSEEEKSASAADTRAAQADQPKTESTSDAPADVTEKAADEEPAEAPAEELAEAEEPAPEPSLTAGQRNAIKSAESYLSGPSAFSKSGLIEQLEFEGFSRSDAAFAVSHVDVSWKEQAVKSAESYLDGPSAFSRSGLIEQLEFEGFTSSQAEYAVGKAYR